MEELTPLQHKETVYEELHQIAPGAGEEFAKARLSMSLVLKPAQLEVWANVGIRIARQSVRSWEVAAQYYKTSPSIVTLMPFNRFEEWARAGESICEDSSTVATCYLISSPLVLKKLRARHVAEWATMGHRLYKGTWKSSTLACKFFENSPQLTENLEIKNLDSFVSFLEYISRRSYDVATDCLNLSLDIFPILGEADEEFIALASSTAETGWRQVKNLFDATARSLPRIQAGQRHRFITLADRLRASEISNVPGTMLDMSHALSELSADYHEPVLAMSEDLLLHEPQAVPEFIKTTPQTLGRVSVSQLEQWYIEGVGILKQNHEGGLAYFRLESSTAQGMLESLSASVEFDRVQELMQMYCQALAGSDIEVAASTELAEKRIGWFSTDTPTTEGTTVYVPNVADRYPTKDENFDLFKVISTHQVARLEFGSFHFLFDLPATQFSNLRHELEKRVLEANDTHDDKTIEWVTDVQRLFNLVSDRQLALDLFTLLEGGRLDSRVVTEYLGMRRSYEKVQEDALNSRPNIKEMTARETLVEFLVRVTLRSSSNVAIPQEYHFEAERLASIAKKILLHRTTVEDTAEAMLRAYAILSKIPNREIEDEEWHDIDTGEQEDYEITAEDDENTIEQILQGMGGNLPEQSSETETTDDKEYEPSQDVDYRGDFKPEMVQLLEQLRLQQGDGSSESGDPQQITQEMLQELISNSVEMEASGNGDGTEDMTAELAENMLKEAQMSSQPTNPNRGQGPLSHIDEEGGEIDSEEPQTFAYDEWDFRADDYKPRWCLVREKVMPEGDPAYYGQTLADYSALVNQIRRQFELLVPEMFRRQRKLEDGEEIDIDDVIEAMVDIKTGASPSDKLYWRRNKVQRDVAVVFLMDTSASTAEAIDESRRGEEWDAPDDPVEYMTWLRTRRSEGVRRSYKRIIDLEKEACVMLINALESIGDVYGIYAFSGYGRENVEFYTVKDIDQPFADNVKKRIDRISPLHATRMGPAIRHATAKLDSHDAKTKLLFLISDGRPQDRGYSREGVEKEYAVHDTKRAFDEARAKNVIPFCLTVDKNGHDYLAAMCQDIGYEILDDILQLPHRLLYLYRRLTM